MRFGSIALALVLAAPLLSHPQSPAPVAPTETEVAREVDRMITEAWQREKLTPSELSSDAEFLRRISIDLTGRVPTADEVVEFLADRNSDKRRKKIDEYLGSASYAKHMADVWQVRLIGRDLRGRGRLLSDPFEKWLEQAFGENRKWDAMVRDLISADGSTQTEGEGDIAYVVRWTDRAQQEAPPNLAGQTVKVFMGIRLQCAQCHDHPYEKWTQQDFWGVAAYFARQRARQIQENQKPVGFELTDLKRGEVKMPGTDKVVAPKFITGGSTTMSGTRRAAVAELVTAKENAQFSRAFVNWAWYHFFGYTFVNPMDDFAESNKANLPEVLELLTRDFTESGFDVKRLLRIIVNTRTYQLSSKSTKSNEKDRTYFSKAQVRPMSPEQLFYSLAIATGLEDTIKDRAKKAKGETLERLLEQGLQRFTFLFDNDEMTESLDFEATITQALFMMNGQFSTQILMGKRGAIGKIESAAKNASEKIDQIYLTVLSRPPTDAERRRFLDFVRQNGDRTETYVDLFWVLLNSTEFFFNH